MNKSLLLNNVNGPTDKSGLHFVTASSGTNVNFFGGITTNVDSFRVYVNGKLTSQPYNSISYNANDEILIRKINSSIDFPLFIPYTIVTTAPLKSILEPFPYMVGSNTRFNGYFNGQKYLEYIPNDLFINNVDITGFLSTFANCTSLIRIPLGIFNKNLSCLSFMGVFDGCATLQYIPEDLFKYNLNVTRMIGCFDGCLKLKNFRLYIGSSIVEYIADFIPANSGGTVIVPENSITYDIFVKENISGLNIETWRVE